MVKIYNRTQVRRIKGYGHVPVRMNGDGTGQVLFQSAKQMAKYAVPLLKKVWANISPEAKQAMFDATVSLGIRGVKKVGTTIQSTFGSGLGENLKLQVESLGDSAKSKLEDLVGDTSDRISKKAEKLLKKLASQTKKKLKKEIKRKALPKSVEKMLTPSQRKKLSEKSEVLLSNLLAGQGLRLL